MVICTVLVLCDLGQDIGVNTLLGPGICNDLWGSQWTGANNWGKIPGWGPPGVWCGSVGGGVQWGPPGHRAGAPSGSSETGRAGAPGTRGESARSRCPSSGRAGSLMHRPTKGAETQGHNPVRHLHSYRQHSDTAFSWAHFALEMCDSVKIMFRFSAS